MKNYETIGKNNKKMKKREKNKEAWWKIEKQQWNMMIMSEKKQWNMMKKREKTRKHDEK